MERLRTIDLFAGAGGLSLGFKMTGKFELIAAAEINSNARATYKKNIAKETPNFEFINNVVGYDFAGLNERSGGIDVVIGGPPCQGFSNANRQKNHLISMNNGLVKEYFRAIKEIRPKAFVMENVSMLRSDTHRFYESEKDNEEIMGLIEAGFEIPQREDVLCVSNRIFENIDFNDINSIEKDKFTLPADLIQLLSVLKKNLENEKRFPNYIVKNAAQIEKCICEIENNSEKYDKSIVERLTRIKGAISCASLPKKDVSELQNEIRTIKCKLMETEDDLSYIVSLEKMLETIGEIAGNRLIGQYVVNEQGELTFRVNSYSVNDYINAILGGEYVQVGNTVNAEWFGVPQERRRHIVLGIRKDLYPEIEIELPKAPEKLEVTTVGQAIMDLAGYEVCYEKEHSTLSYNTSDELSDYAKMMRNGSEGVSNHITTKSTPEAVERFKHIKQGGNFHDLDEKMKSSYSKPGRTQNTIYLRLEPNEPSGTVVNVRKSMWIHPTLDRAVTVREAARLQSFPDNFIFTGTKDSQFQQVGNAVPPLLAKGIAEHLLKYIQ